MKVPDNYDMWLAHDAEQDRWLEERPVCCWCEEHIQDGHLYRINGEACCPECLESFFREEIDY